jgi:hypothetical protein
VRALLIVMALAAPAAADGRRTETDSLLGMRISVGSFPLAEEDRALLQTALALTFEQRAVGAWRLFGELEYLWIGERGEPDPDIEGNGIRGQVGVRRAVARSRILAGAIRFYVDAEVGGGLLLASETKAGTLIEPAAFVGVRAGYDFISERPRGALIWEPELLARGFRMADGYGLVFGVGFAWGN